MRSQRKTLITGMGLCALLTLGALNSWGGLPAESLDTLAWSVVFLTGAGLGANVGEHMAAARRPQGG